MRRFSADYLDDTRRGMWEKREALDALDLPNRTRTLDVGCGTGELTHVLREQSTGCVVGLDADRALLDRVEPPRVQGDATRLPFADDAFDLVVCQALLINLSDPSAALKEFSRVSSDLVAAIEPDNAGVTVDSTVVAEARLSVRARTAYIEGVGTDVTLGSRAAKLFETTGLSDVTTTRYDHQQSVEPPYTEADLESAARKASGDRLAEQRDTMVAGGLSEETYDDLRADWRAMGREVVEQMREGVYERSESIPFYVTVGRV